MTDVRTEIEEETGLNLFEDKASAVGGFPHAMLGYDKQAVDSYIQDLEQRMLEMKVQLREQRRETSFARSQVGTTDFSKLGAHARALLEAAEAQAAELVRLAEAESDRLRQGGAPPCLPLYRWCRWGGADRGASGACAGSGCGGRGAGSGG